MTVVPNIVGDEVWQVVVIPLQQLVNACDKQPIGVEKKKQGRCFSVMKLLL